MAVRAGVAARPGAPVPDRVTVADLVRARYTPAVPVRGQARPGAQVRGVADLVRGRGLAVGVRRRALRVGLVVLRHGAVGDGVDRGVTGGTQEPRLPLVPQWAFSLQRQPVPSHRLPQHPGCAGSIPTQAALGAFGTLARKRSTDCAQKAAGPTGWPPGPTTSTAQLPDRRHHLDLPHGHLSNQLRYAANRPTFWRRHLQCRGSECTAV